MKSKQSKTAAKSYPVKSDSSSKVEEPMVAYLSSVQLQDDRIMSLLSANVKEYEIRNDVDLIGLIRLGISKKSLDYLIAQIGYSIADIASVLHVSDRNLRRYTAKEKLNTEQSERLVEIAKLYVRGEDVFGSIETFNKWMNEDILALGNQKPKSFLDTSLGIQFLIKELGRIEHGVFA